MTLPESVHDLPVVEMERPVLHDLVILVPLARDEHDVILSGLGNDGGDGGTALSPWRRPWGKLCLQHNPLGAQP